MIIVIDALNRARFGGILDEMFRLRARVFGERLGWDVEIRNGMEIDKFDALDPAYVVGLNDEGQVISCVRALQTTGAHMLADVFSCILDGEPPLRSSSLWESTRFCVDTQRLGAGRAKGSVSYATCELMIGSLEFAMRSGISDIVTVIDPVIDRVLRRSDNAPYDYVGSTKPMGKVSAMAALLDCTEERVERVRRFAGITGSVFLDEEQALALFDHGRAGSLGPNVVPLPRKERAEAAPAVVPARRLGSKPIGTGSIVDYCIEQLRAAGTEEERQAALEVVRAIAQAVGRSSQEGAPGAGLSRLASATLH